MKLLRELAGFVVFPFLLAASLIVLLLALLYAATQK